MYEIKIVLIVLLMVMWFLLQKTEGMYGTQSKYQQELSNIRRDDTEPYYRTTLGVGM